MSLVDSQTVDGVFGSPLPPSVPQSPQPAPGEPGASSVWDVPPAPAAADEQATASPDPQQQPPRIEQQQVDQPAHQPDATPQAEPSAPQAQSDAETVRLRQELEAHQQREAQAKQAWSAWQRQQQEQEAFQTQEAALLQAAEQAKYLDGEAAAQHMLNAQRNVNAWYQQRQQEIQRDSDNRLREALAVATAPQWADKLLADNGLPQEFRQYLSNVDPRAMAQVIPSLKAMHDLQQQVAKQNAQTQATNFNQFQQQQGVNRLAGYGGGNAVGVGPKSGSIEHLRSILGDDF